MQVFLQLTEPHQREIFKSEFWARREQPSLQPPLGPGYRSRYDQLRELAVSDFDGLDQDAGKLVVRQGEPDSIQNFTDCNDVFKWVEVWTYTRDKGDVAQKTLYLFYRHAVGAPRRLWYPAIPQSDLMVSSTCLSGFAEACRSSGGTAGATGAGTARPNPNCPGSPSQSTCPNACAIAEAAAMIAVEGPRRRGVRRARHASPGRTRRTSPQLAESFVTTEEPGSEDAHGRGARTRRQRPRPGVARRDRHGGHAALRGGGRGGGRRRQAGAGAAAGTGIGERSRCRRTRSSPRRKPGR